MNYQIVSHRETLHIKCKLNDVYKVANIYETEYGYSWNNSCVFYKSENKNDEETVSLYFSKGYSKQ